MTLLGILLLLKLIRSHGTTLGNPSLAFLVPKSPFSNPLAILVAGFVFATFSGKSLGQIQFDVNSSAPVRSLYSEGAFTQFPNSRLVSLELNVSTLFQPGAAQSTKEILIQCMSRREGVLIVDYTPKTELQSDVFGPMQVIQENDNSRELNLQGLGGYPGIGSAAGAWNSSEFQRQSVQYAQRPNLELTLASGSLHRQRGAYFKIRPNSQSTLEGAKTFGLILSVPANWRADFLDVTIQAAGEDPRNPRRQTVLAKQSFVVGVYQQNDTVAAGAVAEYVKQQSNLIRSVKTYARKIEQRAYPTPFHKLGAKLDLYEPQIPENWLDAVIYNSPGTSNSSGASFSELNLLQNRLAALPVDVRVAVMNFQDQKARIESLAGEELKSSRRGSNDGPQTYTLGYRGASDPVR